MSQRGASILAAQRQRLMYIGVAIMAPVTITFLLFLASTAGGAGKPAIIGFIVTPVNSDANTSGVAYIWTKASTGVGAAGDPAFPTIFLNLINGALWFVVLLVVFIEGIRLATASLERED